MSAKAGPLTVCIDARQPDGICGGVQQVVIGLVSGLSRLADGDERYLILTGRWAQDWIKPYVHGPCQLLLTDHQSRWRRLASLALLPLRRSRYVPWSDGTIERARVDLVHFPTQCGFMSRIPSIYHPWDLQHLHWPRFFSPGEIRQREALYRTLCRRASMVSVASAWCRDDLMRSYRLPVEKVRVVPMAPVLTEYPQVRPGDLDALRVKFRLPEQFLLYPSQTWPHKNHIALIQALALLRDQHGLTIPLICTGRQNDFFPQIKQVVCECGLSEQVRFLGFVRPAEICGLYQLCRGVAIPSLFEGWGLPLTEAFFTGAPVACAGVNALAEQAGDAALLFDPHQPADIAHTVRRLWLDEPTRQALIGRGRQRVSSLSWDRTVHIFRAHYRRIAGRCLSDADRVLLQAPRAA